MINIRTVLVAVCTLIAPLTYAQGDNCVAFEQDNTSIRIPMGVNGSPTVAVLNTGFLPIGISTGLARSLALEVKPVPGRNVIWSAIPIIKGQVENVPITVFGQESQIEQMYVLDNELPFVYLSLLMFGDFITQLNFPQKTLCFLSREALDLKTAKNIEMRNTGGRPAVQVAINTDQKVWLQLQLELPGAVQLTRESAVKLGLTTNVAAVAGSTTPQPGSGILESLMFGPYELGNIAASFPTADAPADAATQMLQRAGRGRGGPGSGGVDIQGSLGREIFKHFVLTIDFKEERMHIFAP